MVVLRAASRDVLRFVKPGVFSEGLTPGEVFPDNNSSSDLNVSLNTVAIIAIDSTIHVLKLYYTTLN